MLALVQRAAPTWRAAPTPSSWLTRGRRSAPRGRAYGSTRESVPVDASKMASYVTPGKNREIPPPSTKPRAPTLAPASRAV